MWLKWVQKQVALLNPMTPLITLQWEWDCPKACRNMMDWSSTNKTLFFLYAYHYMEDRNAHIATTTHIYARTYTHTRIHACSRTHVHVHVHVCPPSSTLDQCQINIDSTYFVRWASIEDVVLKLSQHWCNVFCLLGEYETWSCITDHSGVRHTVCIIRTLKVPSGR